MAFVQNKLHFAILYTYCIKLTRYNDNICIILYYYIGTHYTDNIVGTGYGAYLGLPLLRKKYKDNMSAAEARVLLEDTMKVLLYRDCRTLNSIQIANITSKGVEITEPYKLDTKWEYKRFVDPYTQA